METELMVYQVGELYALANSILDQALPSNSMKATPAQRGLLSLLKKIRSQASIVLSELDE